MATKVEDGQVKGYCMKEKAKNRPMVNVKLKTMKKSGAKAAQGECKKCGTGMYKILSAKDKETLGIK